MDIDKSLDDIISSKRGRGRGRGRGALPFAPRGAQSGGGGAIRRTQQQRAVRQQANNPIAKPPPAAKAVQKQVAAQGSKIEVRNLDFQVNESDLREIFDQISPVKSVALQFDKHGRSVGIAEITFHNAESGARAVQKFNNVPLDHKPMKITVKTTLAPVPVKVATPKPPQVAPAAGPRGGKTRGAPGASRGGTTAGQATRGGRGARGGRGGKKSVKPKTKEELDMELDQFLAKDGTAQ
ncbi:RNA-binding domain-containing protein [Gonapodya prolifera JEL478]|uniref:RNA-binding domain-containing protein n=1 Tax=Gonapodya prolifera (strain JEL478) TaxID=1344416 RepID=A0A139AN11_GONPJ|nr:RNA-binding domain-containing protein [Gonapodya prolifera JEL478]|eukprot:KXS18160.1 RNA-binding domain-containing protein [Gonapodya prolifera JEL478]